MNVTLVPGRRLLLGSILLLFCWPGYRLQAQDAWKAGAARVNITPDVPMWMAGYAARTHEAEGKYCDLWAKVLVIEDLHGNRGVLISLDLVGVSRDQAGSLCQQLKQRYGIERGQVAICCTHTHSGPVVGRNLEPLHYRQLNRQQQSLADTYARTLEQKIVACAGDAIADLEPCGLSWGSGSATFAANRRQNGEADVLERRATGRLLGPMDHDVPVLAVRTTAGQFKAIAFGYACHATVLDDYMWSGDYPGFAELELQHRYPGCVAMFWAGCGADQNPMPRRQLELAKEYGRQLGAAVSAVVEGNTEAISGSLSTSFREVPLAFDRLPTKDQIQQAAVSSNPYERARAEMQLERIAAGEDLAQTYPYPVAVWKLGDQVQFVFLGGEVVVDYAIRLKSEFRGPRTWVAGYANDVMAYIPSRRVLEEGGYEGGSAMVYYGLPTAWAPEVEQVVIETVHALTDQPAAR